MKRIIEINGKKYKAIKEGKNHQAIIRRIKDANVLKVGLKKLISAAKSKNFKEIAELGYELESLGSSLAYTAVLARKAGE